MSRLARGLRLGALALLAALAFVPALAAPTFPPLTGRVVDDAHILPAATVADLTRKLADLEAKTGRQLVVATLPSLQGYEIEDYGYQLGRAWGVGQKGKNDGLLFIVAPNEHKVRVEVGYGLEGIVTDALSSVIIQTRVLPKFRAGDIAGGVADGTDALIDQLSIDQGDAVARVQQAAASARQGQNGGGRISPFGVLFIVFVLFMVLRGGFGRRGGLGGLAAPLILGGLAGRSRDWGGGGGWDGGGGGGGFSGGGGSFGGGGSSGSW